MDTNGLTQVKENSIYIALKQYTILSVVATQEMYTFSRDKTKSKIEKTSLLDIISIFQ